MAEKSAQQLEKALASCNEKAHGNTLQNQKQKKKEMESPKPSGRELNYRTDKRSHSGPQDKQWRHGRERSQTGHYGVISFFWVVMGTVPLHDCSVSFHGGDIPKTNSMVF